MFDVPLGSVGIGLVWGWLLVLIGDSRGPAKRPLRNFLALSLATLILGLALIRLDSGHSLFLFAPATLFSLALHWAWRRSLRSSRVP